MEQAMHAIKKNWLKTLRYEKAPKACFTGCEFTCEFEAPAPLVHQNDVFVAFAAATKIDRFAARAMLELQLRR